MSTRLFSILTALVGLLSVPLLYLSFNLVPMPPTDPTKLFAYAREYHSGLVYGAFLQAVMPFVIVLFALAIVHLAGATTRFSGWATMLGGVALIILTLLEGTLFLAGAFASTAVIGLIAISLIHALQHFYMIAASALLIPLGIVIVQTSVLPRIMGYVAIVVGMASIVVGFIYFSLPIVDGVLMLFIMQIINSSWYPVAAVVLLVRALMRSHYAASSVGSSHVTA